MADYNSVPLGEAGTGAAYILPQGSVAADRYLDTVDYNQKVAQLNQKNKQEQAQALAQSYKENAFKAKNGTLWNNELMALQQKHIQQGSDYAKQGIDIYNPNPNDPNQMAAHDQYMSDRQKLYNMQDVRDQIGKTVAEDHDTLAKSPIGKYDSESTKAQHAFITNNKLSDVVNKGLELPRIQEAYDPATNIVGKLKEATSMTPETEIVSGNTKITSKQFKPVQTGKNIENLFINSPGGANYVQKQTGITPQDAKLIPDTLPEVTAFNDHQLRNTPAGQQAVAQAGITSYSSPQYQQLLQQKSQADLAAKQKYNGFIKQYVDLARSNASEVDKRVPDYSGTDEGRKERAEQRTIAKDNTDNNATPVYNTQDNVAVAKSGTPDPKKPLDVAKRPSTSLLSFDVGNVKGDLTPTQVYNTDNGQYNTNSGAVRMTGSQLKLKPVLNYQTPKGTFRRILSDDEVNGIHNGTQVFNSGGNKIQPSPKDISYKYMLYGQQPAGKGVYNNVAIPWDESVAKSVNKKVNFDQAEAKLPAEVQVKLLNDKISRLYPQLQGQDKINAIKEVMQKRDQQYNQ